jgi:hypothetical protein
MTQGIGSLILLACVLACSQPKAEHNNTQNQPAPADTAVVTQTDSTRPSEKGEWTAGVTSASARASGNVVLTGVRTAQHPDFERLTFEFAGATLPAWHIEYIDKPVRSCGSGEEKTLEGDAWLEVRFTGAEAHDQSGKPTAAPMNRSVGQPIIRQLALTCDFEADVTWVAGVSTPARYKVMQLKGPARLVIDLKGR